MSTRNARPTFDIDGIVLTAWLRPTRRKPRSRQTRIVPDDRMDRMAHSGTNARMRTFRQVDGMMNPNGPSGIRAGRGAGIDVMPPRATLVWERESSRPLPLFRDGARLDAV